MFRTLRHPSPPWCGRASGPGNWVCFARPVLTGFHPNSSAATDLARRVRLALFRTMGHPGRRWQGSVSRSGELALFRTLRRPRSVSGRRFARARKLGLFDAAGPDLNPAQLLLRARRCPAGKLALFRTEGRLGPSRHEGLPRSGKLALFRRFFTTETPRARRTQPETPGRTKECGAERNERSRKKGRSPCPRSVSLWRFSSLSSATGSLLSTGGRARVSVSLW